MADYTSDRTGASIDAVLDNAEAGNMGKTALGNITNGDTILNTGVESTGNSTAGTSGTGVLISTVRNANSIAQLHQSTTANVIKIRYKNSTWSALDTLYHTGNTGNVVFDGTTTGRYTSIGRTTGDMSIYNTNWAGGTIISAFYTTGGLAGYISVNGTATSYVTSSDPRLKDFKAAPTDAEVNAKFDDLFGCFKTFNWKNDPTGDLVWGFDAHATIDAGLDMGSEGEGSRDLALGDVYKTDEAELDEDGVEIKAAVEHKVSPAGVDQSKAVPILLAKIEQLERRLAALEV